MAAEHRTDLIPSPPLQTKVYPLLVMGGFLIIVSSLAIMVVLATVANGVFNNPGSARATAAIGSSLLARQGDLATFPLWVVPFIFLGLAFLVSGIFTVFWGLLRSLQQARGVAMVESVPVLLKARASGSGGSEEA